MLPTLKIRVGYDLVALCTSHHFVFVFGSTEAADGTPSLWCCSSYSSALRMIDVKSEVRRVHDVKFVLAADALIKWGRMTVFQTAVWPRGSSMSLPSCQVRFSSFPDSFALITDFANVTVVGPGVNVSTMLMQKTE